VGIAGGAMLLTAVLLYRLRAIVSACLQVLVGIAVLVIAVGGAQIDDHRGTRADASGPGCLSTGCQDRS
jgi:membrane protein required for beta-lactamase induction